MSGQTALLLLALREGVRAEALDQALARTVAPSGQVATILPESALPQLAHASGRAPTLPDALVTLQPEQCAETITALGPLIDPARSSLLAFRRHAVLPGGGPVRLYFGLRRLARLTLDEFHDYWLNHHAELGRRLIPPHSYHQLHADPEATRHWAAGAGLPASTLDGVVEVHFPDVAALIAQLSRPEVAEEALADERNFIDHARSEFWAYREWPATPET